MSNDESWSDLQQTFGTTDPPINVDPDRSNYSQPKELYADVFRKLNEGEKLTAEEIQKLPEHYQMLYYLQNDATEYEENIKRRAKLKIAREKRLAKLEHEGKIYERAFRKRLGNIPLLPHEQEILDTHYLKVAQFDEPEVEVDAVDILNDVVQGNYTLQDIDMIRKSSTLEPPKDHFANSPIRLLDSVVENVKQQTHDALQSSNSDHFFKSVDANVQERVTPMKLNEIISSCATGIDMMRGANFEGNDARDACESYVKAVAMYEGETKIRNAVHDANKKQMEREIEKLAEVAAVSGAFSDKTKVAPGLSKDLGFNITEQNFDISFVPSEDPDVYKPLEIVSYIGMTK